MTDQCRTCDKLQRSLRRRGETIEKPKRRATAEEKRLTSDNCCRCGALEEDRNGEDTEWRRKDNATMAQSDWA